MSKAPRFQKTATIGHPLAERNQRQNQKPAHVLLGGGEGTRRLLSRSRFLLFQAQLQLIGHW